MSAPKSTTFEDREEVRRRERVAAYDALAAQRPARIERDAFFADAVHALVRRLVTPGSRVLEVGCGVGDLLASLGEAGSVGVDVSPAMIDVARARHPGVRFDVVDAERDPLPEGPFDVILLSDVVGHLADVELVLERLAPLLSDRGRLVVTYYNFVWEPVLEAATRLGRRTPWPDLNWLSMRDITNLLALSGYDVVRTGTDVLTPVRVPFVSRAVNAALASLPVLRELALVDYFVARKAPAPRETEGDDAPSVTVVCPCKNERGNVREAIRRTPVMGRATELLFVDGNSDDGTREEILAAIADYDGPLTVRLLDQGSGKGKGDAVRKGFAAATGDVLMILDADLTVPPEDLPKFYRALASGLGEFVNGVRLVYPMEGEAMRFLNLLGNKFFSVALSWTLEQPIKDSLCGTKALFKRDYEEIARNRAFFGDFDPFGDFDLLFGAARLNLKIVDLPVRYRARTYGETKISRFSHGLLLAKMTAFGFRKLRLGL